MAVTTTDVSPVNKGQWYQVMSPSHQEMLLTSESSAAIDVYVGEATPDSNSAFHVLTRNTPFSSSLQTNVWIRRRNNFNIKVTATRVTA